MIDIDTEGCVEYKVGIEYVGDDFGCRGGTIGEWDRQFVMVDCKELGNNFTGWYEVRIFRR